MNKYELLFIIDNDVTEENKQAIVDKVSAAITENEGEIVNVDKWGVRKYAYPINFKTEGYYVLINFVSNSNAPAEVQRIINITDGTVRCMIVRK
ncbi:MAG: 30S ribosomal protein S6 [Clostridia bacterium]